MLWLVKCSIYFLLVFHLGSRVSEALTATGSFIEIEPSDGPKPDRTVVRLTIYKGTTNGKERTFWVHPYFLKIKHAINIILEAAGQSKESPLFNKIQDINEVSVSGLNSRLQQFSKLHGRELEYTTHSWRYTLSDIVLGAMDNPFFAIQLRLGHKFISESIGYGMHGPNGDEIREAAAIAAAKNLDRFVDRCFSNENIGGVRGLKIGEAIRSGATKSQIHDDISSAGIIPIEVGEDKFCLKRQDLRGGCSQGAGDSLPEVEHCRGDCMFQTQFSQQKIKCASFIGQLDVFLLAPETSAFEKIRRAHELKQSLVAWPDLLPFFEAKMREHPSLSIWFE